MLSILIPVYNFNIVSLVTVVHNQATQARIPFEIIVMDDCSAELLRHQNKETGNLPGVRFVELKENIGRARIRNRLAEMAVYANLLFMDCDSEVPSGQYLANYLPYFDQEVVVCGGRIYHPDPPEEQEFLLRWLFGIRREQQSEVIRNRNPYRSFMTNNFLIPRPVLLQIQFDESIVRYGHEDTLFGLELRKKGVRIRHIYNPLVHVGLELSREFIRKTSEAIENLYKLLRDGKILREDIRDIRLLKAYEILRTFRLVKAYQAIYRPIGNPVMRNLLGPNPRVFAFDLYKLSLFTTLVLRDKSPGSSFN